MTTLNGTLSHNCPEHYPIVYVKSQGDYIDIYGINPKILRNFTITNKNFLDNESTNRSELYERYKQERLLGAGVHGQVFLVVDTKLTLNKEKP